MIPQIAVVRVAMGQGQAHDALEPPVFVILSALTGVRQANLTFFDERRRPLPARLEADWVCLSVDTFAAAHAYILADHYRSLGIKVGLGGIHPTVLPDEAAAHADTVFVGDAEGVWPAFLRDLATGQAASRYVAPSDAPFVDTSGQPAPKGYLPLGVVQLSRGCRYTCDFCSVKALYPGPTRCKSIEMSIGEIAACPHRLVFIADDNLIADRAWARDLFTALVPLKKRWACQVSIDVASDDALLELMRRAGCFLVLIGFESLSPETLRAMHKTSNHVDRYRDAVAAIHRHHMMVYATFVIGYDSDTATTADDILDFAKSCSFGVANFNPLSVYPGTPLYDRLTIEGRLAKPDWWLNPDYRYGELAHVPAGAAARQIEDGCRRARYSFYSAAGILRRLLHPPNWRYPLVFLVVNLVSAREIHRKQGTSLSEREEAHR